MAKKKTKSKGSFSILKRAIQSAFPEDIPKVQQDLAEAAAAGRINSVEANILTRELSGRAERVGSLPRMSLA